MDKRLFQFILIVVGLVLSITSFWGLFTGITDSLYELNISGDIQGNVILDSNLRFYYGLTAGLGLIILWIVPSIEKHATILLLASVMIFLGAIGRIISIFVMGNPSSFFVFFSILELLFPLLTIWHKKRIKIPT